MSALIASLRLVPKNALSRTVGAVLRAPLPLPVVRSAVRGFSRLYGVNVAEAEQPVESYRTFTDFFTRRLRPGLRPVSSESDVACSPVDGAVGEAGPIVDGTMVQAKGRTYSVREFLADDEDARDYEGGTFATIYLAPYDYHRIHSPVEGSVTGYTHVPGHLWPVNARGVQEIDRLFAVNERLITHLETAAGKVAVAKVGATCVGRIRVAYDDVVTNTGRSSLRRVRYDAPFAVDKAGELGVFEMGSTVILLFQAGRVTLDPSIQPGAVLRMGQTLGRIHAADSAAA